MTSRMDRYQDNTNNDTVSSRLSKNELLYKEISDNKTYTEFTDLEKDNVFEIGNNNSNISRRSDYNKNIVSNLDEDIDSSSIINVPEIETKEEVKEEKIYNINDVLERARQNRNNISEEEKQKKMRNVEYSILSDLSQEKVKEYQAKKESGITKEEEDNLEDLIHTITSNSLRKKIDDELLKDLMPDTIDETTVSKELVEEINKVKDKEAEKEETKTDLNTTKEQELDNSFYTRSMDLKKEDLLANIDDEIDESFKDNKGGSFKGILIFLLAIVVIGIVGYIIYNFI